MPRSGGVWTSGETRVKKFTVTHTQLQTAGLTNDITYHTLAPKEMLKSLTMKHSVAFAGPAIASYTLSLGIVGNLVKHLAAKDVLTAVGDTVQYGAILAAASVESHANATALRVAAIAVGANLSVSTAGSVDIWVETVLLP